MTSPEHSRPTYNPTVVQTRLGPVEYAILGTGAPVLVIHGSPGGIDAAALMAGFLPPRQDCLDPALPTRLVGARNDAH